MDQLVALDWGTSSLRSYLIDNTGKTVAEDFSGQGILNVPEGDFGAVLEQQIGRLKPEGDFHTICSGMITSRNGWVETPYASCPATVEDLAATTVRYRTPQQGEVTFVPGIRQLHPHPDIMRGEETQLAGLSSCGAKRSCLLPGTHSKWVHLRDGVIDSFTTFMTGDLYAALLEQTILKTALPSPVPDESFSAGVSKGISAHEQNRCLLKELFSIRARTILEQDKHSGYREYLSGFLIGEEIATAKQAGYLPDSSVTIIGNRTLAGYYTKALESIDITVTVAAEDLAARGLFRIARKLGLI